MPQATNRNERCSTSPPALLRDGAMVLGHVTGRPHAPAVGVGRAPAGVPGADQDARRWHRRMAAHVPTPRFAAADAIGVLRAHRPGGTHTERTSHDAGDVAAAGQVADATDLVDALFGKPYVLVGSGRDSRDVGARGGDGVLGNASHRRASTDRVELPLPGEP